MDLITNQQHIVSLGDLPDLPQVALVRHPDPSLALNRLHHVRTHIGVLTRLLYSSQIIVRNDLKSRSKRAKAFVTRGICGCRARGYRSPPEVFLRKNNLGAILFNSLLELSYIIEIRTFYFVKLKKLVFLYKTYITLCLT